jgi:D-alanyl-D-alanine carboxypeptidase-like protein
MTAVYGASRLAGVDPVLVQLVSDVGTERAIIVIAGARAYADELFAIRTHHSALRDPMNSKHVIGPGRPLARAVDIAPWPLNWSDIPGFTALAAFVKERAAALSIPIVWGGDWTTLKDYDHYELVDPPSPAPATP